MRLLLIGSTYFICGLMDVGCGILRGMGKTFTPMIISLAGACGFRILWIFTVFQVFYTPQCLFLSYPISWAITGTIHYILAFRTKRNMEQEDISLVKA